MRSGAYILGNDRLACVEIDGERHVTNGQWTARLASADIGNPKGPEIWKAAREGQELHYIGRLDRQCGHPRQLAVRQSAVWQSADASFQVLIAWHYHEGLGLLDFTLTTTGAEEVIAVHDHNEAAGCVGYLMPCNPKDYAGEIEAIVKAAEVASG